MNKMKERLAASKTKGKGSPTWKPVAGKQTIRIVPNKFSPGDPIVDLDFHYGINNKTFLSPKSFGRKDPIVEFAEKLMKSGNSEEYKEGKKLYPKTRHHLPILLRGSESEGVKIWAFGNDVYNQIVSIMSNEEEYGDITSLKSGHDIILDFTPGEGSNYAKTTITARVAKTPVTTDKEVLLKIDQQKNIVELFKEPTYAELESEFQKHLNPETEEVPEIPVDDNEEESTSEVSTKKSETPTEKEESSDDLMDEFEKMFAK